MVPCEARNVVVTIHVRLVCLVWTSIRTVHACLKQCQSHTDIHGIPDSLSAGVCSDNPRPDIGGSDLTDRP